MPETIDSVVVAHASGTHAHLFFIGPYQNPFGLRSKNYKDLKKKSIQGRNVYIIQKPFYFFILVPL